MIYNNFLSYRELSKLKTFEERLEYCRLNSKVCEPTFGGNRILNQVFYTSEDWKKVRREVIIRDNGCDLGIEDRAIYKYVLIHHLNPITPDDIINRNPIIYDLDNLITVSRDTHNKIHYNCDSSSELLSGERYSNDMCPWRK